MEIFWEQKNNELCAHILTFNGPRRLHWHENIEICQVMNKPSDFLVDGNLITAEPGDIIVINEYTVHRFLIKNNNTNIRVIQFPLKTVLNANTEFKHLKSHIKASEIAAIPDLNLKIEKLFGMMQDEQGAILAKDNLFFQSLAMSLYFLLMKYFSLEESQRKGKEQNEFYKITEYVNKHYKYDITVKQIAEKLFISRGRVSEVFKKYSGESLNKYINLLRIKDANELLLNGASITEAAMESGFQSIRTFNNTYKEFMGITPSEYLKKKK